MLFRSALCRKLEPHVSTTRERFQALLRLREAGIPTVVWLCPILPFINDTRENLEGVLDLCLQAGVCGVVCFGMGMTLREGSREYFYAQLDRLFPGIKERYIAAYGSRYLLESPNSRQLTALFHDICRRGGVVHDNDSVFRYLRTLEERTAQLSLFG